MKRIGNLFSKLVSFQNLLKAADLARRGKRYRPDVLQFEFDREWHLLRIGDELSAETWRPGSFKSFRIFEPKERLISAAPYPDRVVHHAVCLVIQPIFEKAFIFDSYACRKNKGNHAAVKKAQKLAARFRYVLQCDIRKFFPSIDHCILIGLLDRKLKDRKLMNLLKIIIQHPWPGQPSPRYLPGDDLFSIANRTCGLPIGNQTSQFFGNLILDPLDQWLKRTIRIPGYLRYADDFLVFSDDRVYLRDLKSKIESKLLELRLQINNKKTVVYPCRCGIPFLGYRIFPSHIRLAKQNVKKMKRRLSQFEDDLMSGAISNETVYHSVMAWWGHAQHANSWHLARGLLRKHPTVMEAISQCQKIFRARLRRG